MSVENFKKITEEKINTALDKTKELINQPYEKQEKELLNKIEKLRNLLKKELKEGKNEKKENILADEQISEEGWQEVFHVINIQPGRLLEFDDFIIENPIQLQTFILDPDLFFVEKNIETMKKTKLFANKSVEEIGKEYGGYHGHRLFAGKIPLYYQDFQKYLSSYELLAGEDQAADYADYHFNKNDFYNFVFTHFHLALDWLNGAFDIIKNDQSVEGYHAALEKLELALEECDKFSLAEYADFKGSIRHGWFNSLAYRLGLADNLPFLDTLAFSDKLALEYKKRGDKTLLFQKMLQSWIKQNLSLLQVETVKTLVKKNLGSYEKNQNKEELLRGLTKTEELLNEAKRNLAESKASFTYSLKPELLTVVLPEGKIFTKQGETTATPKTAANLEEDFEYNFWIDGKRDYDTLMKEITSLEEKISDLKESLGLADKQDKLNETTHKTQEILEAPDVILKNFLAGRMVKTLDTEEQKLIEKYLGKDAFKTLTTENGATGLDTIKAQEQKLMQAIVAMNQVIIEQQAKTMETQQKIVMIEQKNQKLQKQQTTIRQVQSEESQKRQSELRNKLETLKNIGNHLLDLGVDKKLDGGNNDQDSARINNEKVDNFNNISEFSSDIGFGFDDKIKGHERKDFTVYPLSTQNYHPTEIIAEFDQTTSRGKERQSRDKRRYENTAVSVSNVYFGETSERVVKLTLPQDYTVNTGTIRLSKNINYNILKDDYGFIYLVFDNPQKKKIEFKIGIGFDDAQDDFYVSEEKRGELTQKLFKGSYSQTTQKELFTIIRDNSNSYKTGESIANLVQQFIQKNYVYTKDPTLNNRMFKDGNQIEEVENFWIDYNGQRVHPAICNISARMAVAYLRELDVPAVVATGEMAMTETEYSGHAWIRYYDKTDQKWKNLDPTPTRQVGEIKYEFTDSSAQKTYALYWAEQENQIEKGALENQKNQQIREVSIMVQAQEKMKNEKTIYNNDQFMGYLLQGELQQAFEIWEKELGRLYQLHENAPTETEKEKAITQLKPFLENSFSRIRETSAKPPKDIKNNRDIYRLYFEHHLEMLEKILKIVPSTEIREIIEKYRKQYAEQGFEKLEHLLGTLEDGKQLVVLQNKLYLRDPEKSFVLKLVLDLSNYEEYHDFQVTPNGKHWGFIAKDKNGKYLYVKNGQESKEKYENIYQLEISAQGAIYLIERVIPDKNQQYENNQYKFYHNGKFVASKEYKGELMTDKEKECVVCKLSGLSNLGSNTIIYINGEALKDTNGLPTKLANPSVSFIGKKALIMDRETEDAYLDHHKLPIKLKFVLKSVLGGCIVRDVDNNILLLKEGGNFNKICQGNVVLDGLWTSQDGKKIIYGERADDNGAYSFKNLWVDGVNVAEGYPEIYNIKADPDSSQYAFLADKPDGSQIINLNGKEVATIQPNKEKLYYFDISPDFSKVSYYQQSGADEDYKKNSLTIIENSRTTRFDNVLRDHDYKGENENALNFVRIEPDGSYSYLINGKPLQEDGKVFTTEVPFNITQAKNGLVFLQFDGHSEEMMMHHYKNMGNERRHEKIREKYLNTGYLVSQNIGIIKPHNRKNFTTSTNQEHFAFILDNNVIITSGGEKGDYAEHPTSFEKIKVPQISDDGRNFGYLGIDGNKLSVVRNDTILWTFEENPNYEDVYYNLDFSDNFKHAFLSKSFKFGGAHFTYNFIDGVYLDNEANNTKLFNRDTYEVKTDETKLPTNTTLVEYNKGKLCFQNVTEEQQKKLTDNLELRSIINYNDFINRVFIVMEKQTRKEKIKEGDKLLILQNYCFYPNGFFDFNKVAYQTRLLASKTQIQQELTALNIKDRNLNQDEKLAKEAYEKYLQYTEQFLITYNQLTANLNLERFCKEMVIQNYPLLFDDRLSEQSCFNGLTIVFSSAIEQNDQKTIEEIIEKIATQSWADKFARSIEPFVFTLSRSLEANAKQGDRHSPAATVKEKWLYIYRKIKDDAQEKDY